MVAASVSPAAETHQLRNGDQHTQPTATDLKSDSGSWSFFKAWLRVTYCAALPLFPCVQQETSVPALVSRREGAQQGGQAGAYLLELLPHADDLTACMASGVGSKGMQSPPGAGAVAASARATFRTTNTYFLLSRLAPSPFLPFSHALMAESS